MQWLLLGSFACGKKSVFCLFSFSIVFLFFFLYGWPFNKLSLMWAKKTWMVEMNNDNKNTSIGRIMAIIVPVVIFRPFFLIQPCSKSYMLTMHLHIFTAKIINKIQFLFFHSFVSFFHSFGHQNFCHFHVHINKLSWGNSLYRENCLNNFPLICFRSGCHWCIIRISSFTFLSGQ